MRPFTNVPTYSLHIQSQSHGFMYYPCRTLEDCMTAYRLNATEYSRYGVTLGSGAVSKHDEHDNEMMSCNDPFIILSVGPRGGIRVERV